MQTSSEPKDTNPYVAVVAKKHRNLKKKLEKITKAEAAFAQGKVLNEEQQALLASKKSVEKSLAEYLSIKQLLEEVAKQEESAAVVNSVETQEEPTDDAKVDDKVGSDAATFTDNAELFAASTMTEPAEEDIPEVDVSEQVNAHLERLIKVLHVYERYTDVTSNPLPDTVDYFGKSLLGLTSITSFQDTLANSVRFAQNFLFKESALSNEIVRGTSYWKLGQIVDSLVEEMERVQQRGTTTALTALLRNTISAPTNNASSPTPASENVPAYDAYARQEFQFGENLGSFIPSTTPYYSTVAPVYAPEPVYQPEPAAPVLSDLLNDQSPIVEEEDDDSGDLDLAAVSSEPVIEDVTEEETTAAIVDSTEPIVEEPVTVAATEPRADRLTKNLRMRGDRSAARRAEEKAHHATTHHGSSSAAHVSAVEPPAPKTFKDRLLATKKETPPPVPVAEPQTPVADAPAETEKNAAPKRSRGNKKSESSGGAAATAAASLSDETQEDAATGADGAEKPKRERNVRSRTRRTEGGESKNAQDGLDAAAPTKKWSALLTTPEAGPTAVVDAKGGASPTAEGEKRRNPRPRPPVAAVAPKAKPPLSRRESNKKEEKAPSGDHSDGFVAVSRKSTEQSSADRNRR